MDFITEWGTRPLVSLPAITGMLAVNVTPLLNNVELAARAGAQLCAFGVGLCMLVLHVRKVRRGPRAEGRVPGEEGKGGE